MKWNHHKPLLLNLKPVEGFYIPELDIIKRPRIDDYYELKMIKNKGYRNLAYLLNMIITGTSQTFIDIGGTSRSLSINKELSVSANERHYEGLWALNYGSSTNPHDVSRYELYSRHWTKGPSGLAWLEELDTETRLQTYHIYAFAPPSKSCGEVGLYYLVGDIYHLLARVILDPPINKEANTMFTEGWRITFPSNYTRWFLRCFYLGHAYHSSDHGRIVKAIDGTDYIIRELASIYAGSTDVMIGRDNTAPTPLDYALKNPIGSLSSQSQGVEIDTTLQECRIVRTGTYTPSVNETLGEVGLFANFTDVSGTARKVMIARGVWDTPLTLISGTPYTIGIVLRLG
jgi:hypothetical protein